MRSSKSKIRNPNETRSPEAKPECGNEYHDSSRNNEAPARPDGLNSGDFSKFGTGLIDAGARRLVIDMAQLEYMSSAGVRAFMLMSKHLTEAGGKLALCFCRSNVHDLFHLCGLLGLAPFAESLEAARRHVQL